MDWKVTIAELARDDLINIKKYIKFGLQSPNAADKLIKKIKDGIKDLSFMPERNPLCDNEIWRKRGLRKLIIDKYIVFYLSVRATKEVIVITVMYGSRDIDRALNNVDPLLIK